jgi:DHA1 family multidrug resistance protein-like MFS transporter
MSTGSGGMDSAQVAKVIRVLSVGQLLRTAQYGISSMAVNQLALSLSDNNHGAVVAHIAKAATFGSLLELLSSPFFGQLTDTYGRKPMLLASGMAKLVPYVLLVVSPSMHAIFALNAMQEVAYQMYRLSDQAILADIVHGPKELAIAQSATSSMMGGALVFGNLAGGYLAKANPKIPFLVAISCNLGFGILVQFCLPETHRRSDGTRGAGKHAVVLNAAGGKATLAPSAARPVSKRPNPVLRLLRSGRVLRLLTISNVLTSVVDLTWTIRSVMALQRIGMGPVEYGVWEAFNGLVLLCSGKATALMLRLFDVHGFNLVAHALSITRQIITAFARRRSHLYLALIPEIFGGEGVRLSCLRALHTRAAVVEGMGIGEAGAALRTLQSISGMIATTVFGFVYQRGSSFPWLLAAVFAVLGEGVFMMLGRDELQKGTETKVYEPESEPEPEPATDGGPRVVGRQEPEQIVSLLHKEDEVPQQEQKQEQQIDHVRAESSREEPKPEPEPEPELEPEPETGT